MNDSHWHSDNSKSKRRGLAPFFNLLAYPNGFRTHTHDLWSWCCVSQVAQIEQKSKTAIEAVLLFWPTRTDLNRWPSESESDALSSCATGRFSCTNHYSIFLFGFQAVLEILAEIWDRNSACGEKNVGLWRFVVNFLRSELRDIKKQDHHGLW